MLNSHKTFNSQNIRMITVTADPTPFTLNFFQYSIIHLILFSTVKFLIEIRWKHNSNQILKIE